MPILQFILLPTLHLLLFLFVILFFRTQKSLLDKCLLAWLAFIFLHLLTLLISFHPDYNQLFNHIAFSLSIVHGPFLYLYTNILTRQIPSFKPILLLHFAPSTICFLLIVVTKEYNTLYLIDHVVSLSSLSVYAAISLKRMRRYQKEIIDLYSNIDQINYSWLKKLIIGILFILSMALASCILYYLGGITPPFTLMFSIMMLLLSSFLGYKNIIVRIHYANDSPNVNKQTSDTSYHNSKLKNEDLQKLALSLEQYIKKDCPYLKMDLKLNDIATALDAYPHYITEVLNTVFKRNFNDFINSYRVDEAKQRLLEMDKKNATIVGIAYDCGFNSKTSFYRIFKQSTGLTPTEYIKQHRD